MVVSIQQNIHDSSSVCDTSGVHYMERSADMESEAGSRADAGGGGPPFQLRFAPRRQLGRSYVSSVKPMGLPAIVKVKLSGCERGVESPAEEAVLRVGELYRRGPRDKYPEPLTTTHQYGWWWDRSFGETHVEDRRLQHHIQDSGWMKEQLRVLINDASYKRL